MNAWNQKIMDEFRANGGKVAEFGNGPLLILHSTGRKSGQVRFSPLMYQDLGGGSLAIFASKAGAPDNPDWYHNVLADPAVTAELGDRDQAFTAREAVGDERDTIWERQKTEWPQFAGYEEATTRTIPVIVLDPA
ncbi:MAG: nitroreductase family deazaflavin-dependent oxidoreductase [Acidimicrobiia bacterium]